MAADPPPGRLRWLVLFLRWGIPLILVAGGVFLIVLGHGHVSDIQTADPGSPFTQIPTDTDSLRSAAGVGIVIIAVMYVMIGWFMRMNSRDGADRAADEAARDYYARTGRWPGEQGSRGSNP